MKIQMKKESWANLVNKNNFLQFYSLRRIMVKRKRKKEKVSLSKELCPKLVKRDQEKQIRKRQNITRFQNIRRSRFEREKKKDKTSQGSKRAEFELFFEGGFGNLILPEIKEIFFLLRSFLTINQWH